MEIDISPNVSALFQAVFYVVSPLVTLLAVTVAYVALLKQSRPHVLVQYRPNSHLQSVIDLVIENLGGGMARNVAFSTPLPVEYFGIEKSDGSGKDILSEGLPAIAAGQRFIFHGGQFGGLSNRLKKSMKIEVTYEYTNPIGIKRMRSEYCVLSVSHMSHMPTRNSAEQAIVDALKGPNTTTLQRIERNLSSIGKSLAEIAKSRRALSREQSAGPADAPMLLQERSESNDTRMGCEE